MLNFAAKYIGVPLAIASLITPASAAATIAAHRAIYELVLEEGSNKAGLASADGRMAFEIAGSECEGWTVNFRMVNKFEPTDDKQRLIDTRSSAWESGDGQQMRYTESEFIDNALDTETMLSAKRDASGGDGSVEMTKPKNKSFVIDPKAIFPVQHQIKLMQAAEQGLSRDVSLVYDGSDEEKSYRTISFIGARKEPGKGGIDYSVKGADKLAAMPSWPISISYFDETKDTEKEGEQTPVYQVSFEMFENGVSGRLTLNYGEFSLRGQLTSLEILDQAACK